MSGDSDERTNVSQMVQAFPIGPSTTGGTDCLVVIYARELPLLGKRFVLDHNPTRVGRGADNQIVLDGNSVSRRHARFEHRANQWLVVDEGSTNGTYCNDEQIAREMVLKNGDRVKIGPAIFKFLSGADVESRYHEEIYRMTIIDGLTQINNQRYLYEGLEREIIRSRRRERSLAILLFDIDHFKRINDVHGQLAGDFVLKELARVVQMRVRRDEVFARYGGEEFCIVMPETNLDGALVFAETLRQKVQEHPFVFQVDPIKVTISIGAALLSESDRNANELIKRADEHLYQAKQSGRNRVCPATGSTSQFQYRRLLDGPSLLEKSLAENRAGALVAFEVDDETAVVEQLGKEVYEAWFRELVGDVQTAIDSDDLIGTWRDRYVLASFPREDAGSLADLNGRVRGAWRQRLSARDQQIVVPQLRFAAVTSAERSTYRDRALHVLIGRLVRSGPTKASPEDDLPFPLAALRAMVSTRRTAMGRIRSLLDGIRTALRFAVAVMVATIRDAGDGAAQSKAALAIARVTGARHGWETLLFALSPLLPENRVRAIAPLARSLSAGKTAEQWAAWIARADTLRREIDGRGDISEDAYSREESWLHALFDTVLFSLKDLTDVRLVSVAEIEDADDDEPVRYGLYNHRGPGEHFPITTESLPFRLRRQWCYLLFEEPGQAPLPLTPFVASTTCDVCGRREIMLLEDLVLGPPGTKILVRGVTSSHEGALEIPEHKRVQPFNDLVRDHQKKLAELDRTVAVGSGEPGRVAANPGGLPGPDADVTSPGFRVSSSGAETGRFAAERASPQTAPPRPPIPASPVSAAPSTPAEVVLLYAMADAPHARQLDQHFVPLERDGTLRLWHQGRATAGEHLEKARRERLDRADVVMLLLSPDLLSSPQLWEDIQAMLDGGTPKGRRIVPVLLRASTWEQTPLRELTALPRDHQPVVPRPDSDAAWIEVVTGVRDMIRAPRPGGA